MSIVSIIYKPLIFIAKIRSLVRLIILKKKGIIIGDKTFISPKAYLDMHKGSKIVIGKNCFITRQVIILNHTDVFMGGPTNAWKKYGGNRISKDVIIGDNVFIGVSSTILPGVTIGDNVIIGANTLVNKDIPSNSVCGGVPVKIIKSIENFLSENEKFDVKSWELDNKKIIK